MRTLPRNCNEMCTRVQAFHPASSCTRQQRGRSVACHAAPPHLRRRELLAALGTASLGRSDPAAASTDVGSYLPSAGFDNFVKFVPDKTKTPALRAGTVDREDPYSFAIPPSWSERKVANIQSGNYCQPRCAEPWTEVIFADDTEGKVSVLVSPLVRLTNQKVRAPAPHPLASVVMLCPALQPCKRWLASLAPRFHRGS